MSEETEYLDSEGRPLIDPSCPEGWNEARGIFVGDAAAIAEAILADDVVSPDDARWQDALKRGSPGSFPQGYADPRIIHRR